MKNRSNNIIIVSIVVVTFFAALLVGSMTGCAGIYSTFGTTPEEVHNAAVKKVSDYAEAAINKKIEASENLSEEGKAKLKAEVAKLKAEILAKIEEIRAKTSVLNKGEKGDK